MGVPHQRDARVFCEFVAAVPSCSAPHAAKAGGVDLRRKWTPDGRSPNPNPNSSDGMGTGGGVRTSSGQGQVLTAGALRRREQP